VSSIECPNVPNVKFDPESRAAVVDGHNKLRSTIAKGTAVYLGSYPLASGKNIYELSWDCEIEQRAQKWADRCIFEHSGTGGENIFMSFTYGPRGSVKANGISATHSWWSELNSYNASKNPENRLNNAVFPAAGHWSQVFSFI
ncbi:Venom allergen 3, partial [Toxocara canis]